MSAMARCTHCNKLLSPSDVERKVAKCHRCRKWRYRQPQKPKPHQNITWQPKRAKQVGTGSGESWWTAYAHGERRGAEFQAEAERRCPVQPQGLVLERRWPRTA